jgi:von Willebrand factor type A domain
MSQDTNRLTRRKIPALLALERSKIPAWLLSLVLHTAILVTLAVLWTPQTKGTGGQRGGPVGIAMVVDQAGEDSYFLNGADAGQDSSVNSAEAALSSLPDSGGSTEAQAEMLKGLLPSVNAGAGSASAAGDTGLGGGNSQLAAGGGISKVKTQVFGVEGEGSRFVYVFDRSDSMNGEEGKPLRKAKAELVSSIKSLGPAHQFQIVFYNDHPLPFGGAQRPRLLHGDERDKELALSFVRDMTGTGGTNHVDALLMALAMSPDVIFFLTDADDNPGSQKIEKIVERADRLGATIHCIQFGNGNRSFSSNWIDHLAERTRGQFKYINVSQF